jgi:hypothetical protein
VATRKACLAVISGGASGAEREAPLIPLCNRASSMACRASFSMCEPSLLADPSTPKPSFTPRASIFITGAMPEASRMLEDGQCATPQPCWA